MYLYYVFMDDDFALGDPRQQLMGPWRRSESSLRSYEPAIAAIDNGWAPRIHNFHAERQCSGEAADTAIQDFDCGPVTACTGTVQTR